MGIGLPGAAVRGNRTASRSPVQEVGQGGPQCPRENTSLLEAQPGGGGGSGRARGNLTGSAKPRPSRPAAHGLATWGWLAGVFTETLALRPAQLLGWDPLRHPQTSKCQLGRRRQRLQLRPCFPRRPPGEWKAEEPPRERGVVEKGEVFGPARCPPGPAS